MVFPRQSKHQNIECIFRIACGHRGHVLDIDTQSLWKTLVNCRGYVCMGYGMEGVARAR